MRSVANDRFGVRLVWDEALATASPPPSRRRRAFGTTRRRRAFGTTWGRDRVRGIPERRRSGVPPPLTPPPGPNTPKGEGDPVAAAARDALDFNGASTP
jgi:hypothetical protein